MGYFKRFFEVCTDPLRLVLAALFLAIALLVFNLFHDLVLVNKMKNLQSEVISNRVILMENQRRINNNQDILMDNQSRINHNQKILIDHQNIIGSDERALSGLEPLKTNIVDEIETPVNDVE